MDDAVFTEDKTETPDSREIYTPEIQKIATFKGSCLFLIIILGIHVSFRECSAKEILLTLVLIVSVLSSNNPILVFFLLCLARVFALVSLCLSALHQLIYA